LLHVDNDTLRTRVEDLSNQVSVNEKKRKAAEDARDDFQRTIRR